MSQDLNLLRLEYKLDLVIRALQANGIVIPSAAIPPLEGIQKDTCPVCSNFIKVTADFESEKLVYTCACKPPISVVRGVSGISNPNTEKEKENDSTRSEANPQVPQHEAPRSSS